MSKRSRWKSTLINQGWFTALYSQHLLVSQSFKFLICILLATQMPLLRRTNIIYQGRLFRLINSPSEKTRPRVYPTAATKCNVSRAKPQQLRRWKSMLIHKGWFTALYSQHLLASQSFEFLICILLALQMPLIRRTNILYQGRLSRHICLMAEITL